MKFYWDITLGQYMPTGSVVHRIEAGAKIIELKALIITIFLVREAIALAMALFFSILGREAIETSAQVCPARDELALRGYREGAR